MSAKSRKLAATALLVLSLFRLNVDAYGGPARRIALDTDSIMEVK